jgi:DNA repair exonuclease SbcCD ATPase subunit
LLIRIAFIFAFALSLTACTGVRVIPAPVGEPENRETIDLLLYSQRFLAMSPAQQRVEYDAASLEFANRTQVASQMRLALILATGDASIRDSARAARLLEPLAAASDEANPLHALAKALYRLLTALVDEQAQANQLRDRLESQADIERKLRKELASHKEAERTMRQQIDELKEVERAIMQRRQESKPRRK